MRKRPKPSTTLGYPKLTSEQIGQFIVRMQAVRAYEEKLMLLIADEDVNRSPQFDGVDKRCSGLC